MLVNVREFRKFARRVPEEGNPNAVVPENLSPHGRHRSHVLDIVPRGQEGSIRNIFAPDNNYPTTRYVFCVVLKSRRAGGLQDRPACFDEGKIGGIDCHAAKI